MIYLLLASFLWGTSFIAGKYAYELFDPYMLVQLRMAIASAFVLPGVYKKRASLFTLLKNKGLKLLFVSFLIYPATFILQFLGLKYTSASSATTMIGIEPFMVVLVGFLFFKRKTHFHEWVLGVCSFIGIALVAYSSNQDSGVNV